MVTKKQKKHGIQGKEIGVGIRDKKMTRLNPKVDFAFKKLFGSEENKDIFISFVNSIVSKEDQICDIEFKNPYMEAEFVGDKKSILDVKAKDLNGRYYNLEVQIKGQEYYDKRALYYWSRLYTSQLKKAGRYETLNKTVSIHVLVYNRLEDKGFHNEFKILNTKTHKPHFEDLEIHVIELEKFNKALPQLKSALDLWVTFLKEAENYSLEDIPKELEEVPEIKKAIVELETMYFNESEIDIYDARLKWFRDQHSELMYVRNRCLKQGKEKGLKEGREVGIKEGKEKGLKEGQMGRNFEIAKMMLKDKESIDKIIRFTGLTKEIIHSL